MYKDKESFVAAYKKALMEEVGSGVEESDDYRKFTVLVNLIREQAAVRWAADKQQQVADGSKQVYFFSMEFLIGRLLEGYLINLDIYEIVRDGLASLNIDLATLCRCERDAGLGNGGLGRLAACYLDSMAFLGLPGHGNGIRYRYGLFQQKIVGGYQVELTDDWLRDGYPWETRKPEKAVLVRYGGRVKEIWQDDRLKIGYDGGYLVRAVPYDVPVVGYGEQGIVNNLRLWSAEPLQDTIDLNSFNAGDVSSATKERSEVEAISYLLYPNDSSPAGRELRLKQEYFFVSAGLQTIVADFAKHYRDFSLLPQKVAVHINDTHPALCIPELMRLLVDEYGLAWDDAWSITVQTISFTNHTVLPEALEKWDVSLLTSLLPRLMMIIREIDRRCRAEHNIDEYDDKHPLAIIGQQKVRMANLAVYGSHVVNGVAALHTEILKKTIMKPYYQVYPDRFQNKTNGVNHRRFLCQANPALCTLLRETIGDGWLTRPEELSKLQTYADDRAVLAELSRIKHENKCRLATRIRQQSGLIIDPSSIFDAQIKRFHAYKRQLLNAMQILARYIDLKRNPWQEMTPVTYIIAGKAASSYHFAKTVIKLVNALAEKINNDRDIGDRMKVVFWENYNVSAAEEIIPATEISEQISTAGYEASGTSNMKFMFNGGITLGTFDGANVEIHDIVGDDNMATFGLRADEAAALQQSGTYFSWDAYNRDARLKEVVDHLIDGFFTGMPGEFCDLYDMLLRDNDHFFVLKDFAAYDEARGDLMAAYRDQEHWQRMSLHNIAGAGFFASDRAVREYARDIWHIPVRPSE